MQTATLLHMNTTDLRSEDRPFDPIRDMKRQLDALASHIGGMRSDVTEIRTALTGNEFGNEGLVARMERIETQQDRMASEIEALKRAQRASRRYLNWAFTAAGALALAVFKMIVDRLIPIKK